MPCPLVVVLWLGEQVYRFAVVVAVAMVMIVIVAVLMMMTVAVRVMPMIVTMPMIVVVAVGCPSAHSGKAKLAHFAVHLNLTELGFDLTLAQNLHESRMTPHFWQVGHSGVGILGLLLLSDINDFFHQHPGK